MSNREQIIQTEIRRERNIFLNNIFATPTLLEFTRQTPTFELCNTAESPHIVCSKKPNIIPQVNQI